MAEQYVVNVKYHNSSYEELCRQFDLVSEDYEYVNSDHKYVNFRPIEVCKNISVDNRPVTFELVHLGIRNTERLLEEHDRLGFRPGLYEELLSFAAQYPDEQKQYPIAALGSFCSAALKVELTDEQKKNPMLMKILSSEPKKFELLGWPCLDLYEGKRRLYVRVPRLGSLDRGWNSDYRFLVVRK